MSPKRRKPKRSKRLDPPEERCRSPLRPWCGSGDLAVYIMWQGERLPICHACWAELADSNLEWGEK